MRGGKRTGSGRKKGSNAYSESTKPIRVPLSLVDHVYQLLEWKKTKTSEVGDVLWNTAQEPSFSLPLFESAVSAGIPFMAEDRVDQRLDLNHYLIRHPHTTFFVRVSGDSMIDAHIQENDILVVDRGIQAKHKDIVIAVLENEITVKRLIIEKTRTILMPENKNYQPIIVPELSTLTLWGVVTSVIHKVK